MNDLTQTTLSEFKTFLKALKPSTLLCPGLGNPHVYRGGGLAFRPQLNTTAGQLLEEVNRALTAPFPNPPYDPCFWDGCECVWVAQPDHYGKPLTFGMLLMAIDPWINAGEGFNRTH